MATTTPVKDPHERLVRRMQDRKKTFEAKDVDGIMSCYAEGEAFSAFEFMPPIGFHGGDMWRQNRVAFFAAWSARCTARRSTSGRGSPTASAASTANG
jgi:hypothetical protein